MVYEDIHWSDPTTRESLDLFVDRIPPPHLGNHYLPAGVFAAVARPSPRHHAHPQPPAAETTAAE